MSPVISGCASRWRMQAAKAISSRLLQKWPNTGAGAVVVSPAPLFNSYIDQIAALAIRHATPMIFGDREAVKAGNVMSYGPERPNLYHQIGAYAGRILKGEKPADLPVQRSTKFELAINLKTAKSARPRRPAQAARHRRRGDRIIIHNVSSVRPRDSRTQRSIV